MARRPRERRPGPAGKARRGRKQAGGDDGDKGGGSPSRSSSRSRSRSPSPSSSDSGGAADFREEEQADARREASLRQQLERMKQLPKASRYARHRVKQITTCLDLIARRKRTRQQQDLLSRLRADRDVM